MLEQYNHLLILCLFLNVISGFLFLRDKKFNEIIASGILSFFLLLSVIRDFQFSLSKLLFLLAKKKKYQAEWYFDLGLPPSPSPSSYPWSGCIWNGWSLLMSPAAIQLFASSPPSHWLPSTEEPRPWLLATGHHEHCPRLPELGGAGGCRYRKAGSEGRNPGE